MVLYKENIVSKTDESDKVFDDLERKLKENKDSLREMEDCIDILLADVYKRKEVTETVNADNNPNHLRMLSHTCSKVISQVNDFFNNITSIQLFYGIEDNHYDFYDKEFVDATDITKTDNILHIKYPVLLPKKFKEDKQTGSYNKRIKYTYTAAIADYFKNHKEEIKEYKEKVVLFIIHHYPSELCVKDHDNYSLREIINCLSTYILVDDNAKWLAHYQDYIIDGNEYSEIYIVPDSQFIEFLKRRGSKA